MTLLGALIFGTALFAFHAYEARDLPADESRVTKANVAPKRCPQFKPSALATKYLENLHGIEIGASTQNSFGLKRSINVDFSDEQGGLWQDKACAPAVVNIVALGDNLPFKDNTLDYVLTSQKVSNYARPKVYDQTLPHKLIRGGARLEEGWTYYEADDHHHWSVWRTADFVELVKLLKFNAVEIQDVDDKVGNGFTVVIRK